MLGFLYFCNMRKPLSKQEMHNLAMNHVGKDLESRGFEFVAINMDRVGQALTAKLKEMLLFQ